MVTGITWLVMKKYIHQNISNFVRISLFVLNRNVKQSLFSGYVLCFVLNKAITCQNLGSFNQQVTIFQIIYLVFTVSLYSDYFILFSP